MPAWTSNKTSGYQRNTSNTPAQCQDTTRASKAQCQFTLRIGHVHRGPFLYYHYSLPVRSVRLQGGDRSRASNTHTHRRKRAVMPGLVVDGEAARSAYNFIDPVVAGDLEAPAPPDMRSHISPSVRERVGESRWRSISLAQVGTVCGSEMGGLLRHAHWTRSVPAPINSILCCEPTGPPPSL